MAVFVQDTSVATPRIDEQIAEVRREIETRKRVYPGLIHSGKLKQPVADYSMRCIESTLKTLEYMRDNREVIVAAVRTARGDT